MNHYPVMLAEDNADDEALTLRFFRKANIQNKIEIVRDGQEAVDYLFSNHPSGGINAQHLALALLDIRMPKLNGLDVLEQIRLHAECNLLPVVMLTSSDEQIDIRRAYELGCNSYVRKPVEISEFSEAVRRIGVYWLLTNQSPISISEDRHAG